MPSPFATVILVIVLCLCDYRAVVVFNMNDQVIEFDWWHKFPLIKSFVPIYICNELNK
jgi:multisubunit Na+/H+ antiporter MnhF subunit